MATPVFDETQAANALETQVIKEQAAQVTLEERPA
jgi:hypothetical protein